MNESIIRNSIRSSNRNSNYNDCSIDNSIQNGEEDSRLDLLNDGFLVADTQGHVNYSRKLGEIYKKAPSTIDAKKAALPGVCEFINRLLPDDKNKLLSLMAEFKYGRSGVFRNYTEAYQNKLLSKIYDMVCKYEDVITDQEVVSGSREKIINDIFTVMRGEKSGWFYTKIDALSYLFKATGFNANNLYSYSDRKTTSIYDHFNSNKEEIKRFISSKVISAKDIKYNKTEYYKIVENTDAFKNTQAQQK